jgi:hypothetical protein
VGSAKTNLSSADPGSARSGYPNLLARLESVNPDITTVALLDDPALHGRAARRARRPAHRQRQPAQGRLAGADEGRARASRAAVRRRRLDEPRALRLRGADRGRAGQGT